MSEPLAIRVAVIGAGEMGAAVARRMRECGARVMTPLKGRSAASVERVKRAGIEVIDDDAMLANEADFVLSIVPPGVAVEVAHRYRDVLQQSARNPFFVECNAIAPATTREIEKILGGIRVIDAGIIGGPPAAGTQDPLKGPRFYASGEFAPELMRLSKYGLDIAVLDGPVGAASALKLAYAGMTKGFTAIATAMLNAASRVARGTHADPAAIPRAPGALDSRHVPESLSMGRRDGANLRVHRRRSRGRGDLWRRGPPI
jgi:3-hydroxyisobutyrate dehydrogenase-like beta-hydroxyacid dehydrogenase